MAEEASGLLSPARNESIFRADILRDYLPDTMGRAERPRLVLLGGQSGAGKTAVLAASQNELARSGPTIRIIGGDLRSYHPEFLALPAAGPGDCLALHADGCGAMDGKASGGCR
jgi:hypothetical protein